MDNLRPVLSATGALLGGAAGGALVHGATNLTHYIEWCRLLCVGGEALTTPSTSPGSALLPYNEDGSLAMCTNLIESRVRGMLGASVLLSRLDSCVLVHPDDAGSRLASST